jgi:hypothetical protein
VASQKSVQIKPINKMTITNRKSAGGMTIRALYILTVLMGIYFIASGKAGDAMIPLGVGLVFDPFDANVKWKNRKLYQKGLLLTHLIIVFILLAVTLIY